MRLAFNKKQTDAREQEDLAAEFYECHKKQEFLRISVRSLLDFIKEFYRGHILPLRIMVFVIWY